MDIDIREIEIRDLRPNSGEVEGLPRNPRKISKKNLEKLKKSVQDAPEMLRLRELIVVPHGEGYVVIAGNQRLEAAKAVGMESLPCKVLPADTDPAKLREYAIKDNLPFGEDDWEVIASDWDTAELEEWGMSVPDKWKDNTTAEEDDFDPNSVKETVCKKGDIWQLGKHRLMCGDSTDASSVELLMDGKRARMVVTSPPYGVGKDYEKAGIEPWRNTIKGVIDAIKGKALIVCWNIVDLFKTGTQYTEPTGAYSIAMWDEAGYGMLYNRIWKKPGGNFAGNNPYYTVTTKPVQDYEYLYAFAERDADNYVQPIKDYLFREAKKANINNEIIKSEGGPAYMFGHWFTNHQWAFIDEKNYAMIQSYCEKNGIDAFRKDYGLLKDDYLRNTIFSHSLPSNDFSEWGMYGVWEFSTVHERLGGHAAAFPVELPTRYIKLHSYEGDIVLDPFGGTGTTLIAAEQLNRKCYMMELDTHYCDVIIARWEKLTGKKATKIN